MRLKRLDPFLVALLLLGLSGLLGCASIAQAPAWVESARSPEYSKEKFVTALGTGENLELARGAAKSELSRIFSAELKSEIELIDQESVVGDQVFQSSEMLTTTIISTEVQLEGVEVPLHWRDPRSGEIWALAVLERRKECLRIRSEGKDLITRLDSLSANSQTRSNPLVAVRSALHAVKLGVALDGLQARSRVLGSQCLTRRSVSTGALKARVDASLAGLSFVVAATELDLRTGRSTGLLPQLQERIAGNLTRMGFQVGPAQGATVIPIDARLRLGRVDRGTEWIEYRWEGSAEIGSPVQGGPTVIAAESEGAESHPTDSTARLRARRKGELDLARQLNARLEAFLAAESHD